MSGRWFSPGPPVYSTNKTDRHDITEILLKVALNTIKKQKKLYSFGIQYEVGKSSFPLTIWNIHWRHEWLVFCQHFVSDKLVFLKYDYKISWKCQIPWLDTPSNKLYKQTECYRMTE